MAEEKTATWSDTYGDDISFDESELWETELGMSFDDHENIFRWQINDMSAVLLNNLRGAALGEICSPTYRLQEKDPKDISMSDVALANAVGWIRDVQLEDPHLTPVRLRLRVLAYIEEAAAQIDAVRWLCFFGYVLAKRKQDDLTWQSHKENTARDDALREGKKAYNLWREHMEAKLGDSTPLGEPDYPLGRDTPSETEGQDAPTSSSDSASISDTAQTASVG